MGWTLVTGGGKRLGAAICRLLAFHGYDIVVHYRSSQREAWKVVEDCRALGVKAESIQGDFSTPESTQVFIREYISQFHQTETVINNVGNYLILPGSETKMKAWEDLFQTNFFAPLALIQALLPSIKNAKGNIVNIGTTGLENRRADTYATAYMMSKMNLWMLTKSLARELAPFQVRVNMVSPGFLDISVDQPKSFDSIPMKRMGKADEVARVVRFLIDKESRYITGQNIEVAGAVGL